MVVSRLTLRQSVRFEKKPRFILVSLLHLSIRSLAGVIHLTFPFFSEMNMSTQAVDKSRR